jgi:hypothetical protein
LHEMTRPCEMRRPARGRPRRPVPSASPNLGSLPGETRTTPLVRMTGPRHRFSRPAAGCPRSRPATAARPMTPGSNRGAARRVRQWVFAPEWE